MFYLAQAGAALQRVDTDGTVTTLSLPANVTIDPTIRGVFAVLGGVIVFAKAPTVNLIIDPNTFAVQGLAIQAPTSGPVLAAGSSTGLTGVYSEKVSFATKNANGVIINESPLSPASNPLTITNKDIVSTNIPVSANAAVNCRVLYRTAAGGTVYFKLLEIDDNVSTTITNATADAALSLLPANPNLGNAPGTSPGTRMRLLIEWQGRLWGVSDTIGERDDARYTQVGSFYQWPSANSIPSQGKGEDSFGIMAYLRRRDDLGIIKRSRIMKIIGDSPSNFQVIGLSEKIGCIAPDSVVVIRNKAYWLNDDGVYRWDDNGIVCISRDAVDDWFTTDTYFNRQRFASAFASWNAVTNAYELSIAALGSSVEDRWVSFHIDANGGQGEWLGPHRTSAFTPTSRVSLTDDDGISLGAIGGDDGYIYQQNTTAMKDIAGDDSEWSIPWKIRDRYLCPGNPNATSQFGRLALISRAETGGTLTCTPYMSKQAGSTTIDLGGIKTTTQASFAFDLTRGQQIQRRLGTGRMVSVEFEQAVIGRRGLLFGYNVGHVFEVGVRG